MLPGELSGQQITNRGLRQWYLRAGASTVAHGLERILLLTRWGEARIFLWK